MTTNRTSQAVEIFAKSSAKEWIEQVIKDNGGPSKAVVVFETK